MLPDSATLATFAAASFALYLMPGPDMLYIASRSIGQGWRAGVVSAFGTCTGLMIHTLAAALGLSALLVVSPLAYLAVKWLGVGYLMWLGLRTLFGRGDAFASTGAEGAAGAWRIYRQGALINLLNPKIALFFLAFLPQFVDAGEGFVVQMIGLGALFTSGGLVWTLFLAASFGRAGDWLARRPAVWRWQRRFTGSVFIALAGKLALDSRG